jgi:Na+/H+-dicarboxylate symporter
MLVGIFESIMEGLFEFLVEIIFKTFFNSIGAAIRWLFFIGKYSYSTLFEQFTRNILTAILFFILLIGGGIWLNENSKKEIQEQESNSIKTSFLIEKGSVIFEYR